MNERQCKFSENRLRAGELLTRSAGEELFTPEELAAMAAEAETFRYECENLTFTPEETAKLQADVHDMVAEWEALKRKCSRIHLTPEEMELRLEAVRDVSPHKSEGGKSDD